MKFIITGHRGFIGSALKKRLESDGHYVMGVNGDVSRSIPDMDYEWDYFLHFGSPSSNIMFQENPSCIDTTIRGFLNVAEFCRDRQIKLIYPSSGTIYSNQMNMYSYTKLALENTHKAYRDMLGLRIFAGYGEGEESKGKYASIIYQFAKMMKQGQRPLVWGDGEATRDYVYIDDIVDTIVDNLDRTGFMDIGTGINTSTRDIVSIINEHLGTQIKPVYKPRPTWHADSTECSDPIEYKYSVSEGIKKLLESLR